jgi:hypothetical protein
MVKTITETI